MSGHPFEDAHVDALEREVRLKRVHGLEALRSPPYSSSRFYKAPKKWDDAQNRWKPIPKLRGPEKFIQRPGSGKPEQEAEPVDNVRTRDAAARTTIADFPQELLSLICKDTALNEDDIYNLCYVRVFSSAATEVLYSRCSCTELNIIKLYRTLLEKPSIAKHVRVLEINLDPFQEEVPRYVAGLASLVTGAFGDPPEMPRNRVTAILAAIMVVAPNVQSLSFPAYFRKRPSDTDRDYRQIATLLLAQFSPPTYDSLRKFHIEANKLNIILLAPLFTLRQLNTLCAKGFFELESPDRGRWHPSIFGPEHQSNIACLDLQEVDLDVHALNAMLNACKSLQTLSVEGARLRNGDASTHLKPFDFSALRRTLERFTDCLRFLNLHDLDIALSSISWTPLGSLTEFHKLECLRVDAKALYARGDYHWDYNPPPKLSGFLPSGIREVHLNDLEGVEEYFVAGLQFDAELIEDIRENSSILPELKVLAFKTPNAELDYKIYTDTQVAFWERGAEFWFFSEESYLWVHEHAYMNYECVD